MNGIRGFKTRTCVPYQLDFVQNMPYELTLYTSAQALADQNLSDWLPMQIVESLKSSRKVSSEGTPKSMISVGTSPHERQVGTGRHAHEEQETA
jgi:hypothetical protein